MAHVTASTTDDIRVAISYNQKVVFQEQTINNTKTDSATLSGAKSYDRSFSVTFRDPSDCGLEDTRTVTVTLTPGGKSDSASKVLSFPSCGGVIE